MIEVAKIEYRIVVVAPDGAQYDLTPVANSLGWSEGEKELAAKITCKFAIDLKEQNILEKIQMNGQLIVYVAKADDENFEEMVRGNIIKYGVSETNSGFTLDVEAADEAHALRHTQEDFFLRPIIRQPKLSKRFWTNTAFLTSLKSPTQSTRKKFIAADI